jgi:hypothetical protein
MPIKTVRKIMELGGSKTVALSPGWLAAVGLGLEDQVLVVANGVVLIAAKGTRLRSDQLAPLIQVVNRSAHK